MDGLEGVQLRLVDSVSAAADFMTWLGNRRPILAVDTETTGLEAWAGDRIRLIQFGDAMTGWAIPWDGWSGVAIEAINRYQGEYLFHNSVFDLSMIDATTGGQLQIDWGRVQDTMLMAYVVEHHLSVALKALAARLVDRNAAALQGQLDSAMKAAGWTWATVPISFRPYWSYGALDPVLTSRIYEHMWPRVQANPQWQASYELELASTSVVYGMMKRGARVDVDFAVAKRQEFQTFVGQAREWCETTHGVLPSSNQKMVTRLQELGVHLTKRTKSNALSCDKEVLEDVIVEVGGEAGQLAQVALQARQLQKLSSTYLDNFITKHVDGRIHAQIRVLGAERTGRMTIQNPGLQTLPRDSERNPAAISVRDCFIPSEGCQLVMCDYDQIEYRLLGHFAQDPALMAILWNLDEDPFTEMARRIYSDPTLKKKDPRRQMTKNAAYAKGYGSGAEKFSHTAGVPVSIGRPFYEAFDQTFPGLRVFQNQVQQVGQARLQADGEAWVQTPFGKRMTCEPAKVYKLVNRLVQGTAADVFKTKLVELAKADLDQFAILPVHDEVVFDVPNDLLEQVINDAPRVMNASDMFTVPMPVGVDGPFDRWGAKYR
jgi:DNA polymerase-1